MLRNTSVLSNQTSIKCDTVNCSQSWHDWCLHVESHRMAALVHRGERVLLGVGLCRSSTQRREGVAGGGAVLL